MKNMLKQISIFIQIFGLSFLVSSVITPFHFQGKQKADFSEFMLVFMLVMCAFYFLIKITSVLNKKRELDLSGQVFVDEQVDNHTKINGFKIGFAIFSLFTLFGLFSRVFDPIFIGFFGCGTYNFSAILFGLSFLSVMISFIGSLFEVWQSLKNKQKFTFLDTVPTFTFQFMLFCLFFFLYFLSFNLAGYCVPTPQIPLV